ncbi:flagellar biosynthesis sigma factor [Burkholderia ubonensis]|uniref:FliA/WhiG family RNA polymerase sigma factor n=1 Tax=Burkholderia ubonensis TaxID=101571 RepID=UPI000751DD07|nr:FliA/WhiG family RNA polymerase sigma factor [Burkholderia ubonensis]KVO87707.1 flagellar biosynthesis sigma factor [Burkholderia ubonensis]KVZ57324.1 flagellar biosynthesis sigma factor [Burkholderia ubonensis]KVZ73021.1 flagellar biosynthesis sigma factor [Burkholderia ubonensis]
MTATTYTEYANVESTSRHLSPAREAHWIVEYAPLVKRVVGKLSGHAAGIVDRDDLEQIGVMGLLEALRRYGEPDDEFPNYAVVRVRGAILDELRRQDWRPRTTRQSAHRLHACERALRSKLGREPERDEVCAALGIDTDEYDRLSLDVCADAFMSLDELIGAKGNALAGQCSGPEAQVLMRRELERALLALDEREQRVVQLYYEFDLNLAEIGKILNLTTARICQLHRAALEKMRAYLERP